MTNFKSFIRISYIKLNYDLSFKSKKTKINFNKSTDQTFIHKTQHLTTIANLTIKKRATSSYIADVIEANFHGISVVHLYKLFTISMVRT